jgi:hypothetical protein
MGWRRWVLHHVPSGLTRRRCGSDLAARLKFDDSVSYHVSFIQLLKQIHLDHDSMPQIKRKKGAQFGDHLSSGSCCAMSA